MQGNIVTTTYCPAAIDAVETKGMIKVSIRSVPVGSPIKTDVPTVTYVFADPTDPYAIVIVFGIPLELDEKPVGLVAPAAWKL